MQTDEKPCLHSSGQSILSVSKSLTGLIAFKTLGWGVVGGVASPWDQLKKGHAPEVSAWVMGVTRRRTGHVRAGHTAPVLAIREDHPEEVTRSQDQKWRTS